MDTRICTVIMIAIVCHQKFVSCQDNLSKLAQKHYEKCDCLIKTAEAFESAFEIVLADCWANCFRRSSCFAFEYCDESKSCRLYDAMSIGYNAQSVISSACERHPDFGYSEFYIIKRVETGETFDCEDIKWKNQSAEDGYFDIKIRGVIVEVFCVMTDTPVKTYVDVGGKSVWGGSITYSFLPIDEVIRTWTRVQIQVTSCLTLIICDDLTFSEINRNDYYSQSLELYFGYGSNCAYGTAESRIDLSTSPFFISSGIDFNLHGSHLTVFSKVFEDGRQVFHITGSGFCAGTIIYNIRGVTTIPYKIPLLLNQL